MAVFSAVAVLGFALAGDVLATQTGCGSGDGHGDDCAFVECHCDSDCGSSAFTGDAFCQGGDVYRNYRTSICLNPGTEDAACDFSTAPRLWYSCESWQTCNNGFCVDDNIECGANSDCGSNGFVGEPFCQGNSVYQNYKSFTCNSAGTSQSYCSNNTYAQLKQTCGSNQTCQSGNCAAQYSSISAQTKPATNITVNQATLNGYLYNNNTNCNADVWFEYGTTSNYGYQTNRQTKSFTTNFSQNVNLYGNYANYHFRAVAQDCQSNTVYGQDLSFFVNAGQGALSVSKTARNLTSGSGWSNIIYANPADTLMFMITLRAPASQNVSNATVRDYFPNNLTYKDQLIVSGAGSNYSGDINSGINIGSINSGQTVAITYQAQVAPAQNFSYGTTTLNNNVSVTSSGSGYAPSSSASIIVTRSAVYGATTIPTGFTNNFWLDSFILPLTAVLIGVWLWRAGLFFGVEKWLTGKNKTWRAYNSERQLNKRISAIQKSEN